MSSIFAGSKFVPRWRVAEARDGGIAFEQMVTRQDVETSIVEAIEAGQPVTEEDVAALDEAIEAEERDAG